MRAAPEEHLLQLLAVAISVRRPQTRLLMSAYLLQCALGPPLAYIAAITIAFYNAGTWAVAAQA